ncbi:MAG TPA: hypothetical protein VFO79_00295, partial [Xanthomonadales bacterium]|nr:hypothetical protein [Xanthomonadales bacterium]
MSPFTPTIAPARPRTSPFTSPAGVEAWDAWFRWRDATGLRDLTVDATWARVASALVPRSGDGHLEVDRYRRAFADWRLLPDPVLLRRLGTGGPAWSTPELTAVVNVAACVQSPATPQAALDEDSLAFATRLAARLLDDAAATV